MAPIIPKKICPIMSTATDTRFCDRDCKLLINCYGGELKCVFELMATSSTHKG